MNRHNARVLECALHVHLAPPRSDLALRVLHRWQAGDRGDTDATARASRRPTLRQWRVWLAAMLATLASVWVWSNQAAQPLATSALAVATLRPASAEPHARTHFAAKDTLWLPPNARIEVTDRGQVTASTDTMLMLDRMNHATLVVAQLGSLQIECQSQPLLVRTPLGTVELGAASRLLLHLVPDDYSTPFRELATDMHMHTRTILLSTSITLLAGAGRLLDGPTPGELTVGQTVQDPAPAADPHSTALFDEIGAWTVQMTDFVDGKAQPSYEASEVRTAGPGRKWLLGNMEFRRGDRLVQAHEVTGYNSKRMLYTGSFVDSFGGQMALLEGAKGEDPKVRVLMMRGFHGDRDDNGRITMRWINANERATVLEAKVDGKWVTVREMKHLRKP